MRAHVPLLSHRPRHHSTPCDDDGGVEAGHSVPHANREHGAGPRRFTRFYRPPGLGGDVRAPDSTHVRRKVRLRFLAGLSPRLWAGSGERLSRLPAAGPQEDCALGSCRHTLRAGQGGLGGAVRAEVRLLAGPGGWGWWRGTSTAASGKAGLRGCGAGGARRSFWWPSPARGGGCARRVEPSGRRRSCSATRCLGCFVEKGC